MATEAPRCPKCQAPCGTPVNVECGVERGRWYGPDDANLKCPACGSAWIGDDQAVADAWRSFVEYEQKETGGPTAEEITRPQRLLAEYFEIRSALQREDWESRVRMALP
jgi:hypothetical protein